MPEQNFQSDDDRLGESAAAAGGAEADVQSEQLDYVADMLGELKQMARSLGAHTLSDLLGLAHVEAARVAAKRRSRG